MKCYAGIGARKTPQSILQVMADTAYILAQDGYTCHTGAALGPDQAFGNAAHYLATPLHLFLPWASYEEAWVNTKRGGLTEVTVINGTDTAAMQSVFNFHPAADKLKQAVIKLHARNYLIINGVEFVVCYTPGGNGQGGTGQGIRIAKSMHIPVYDLGNTNTLLAFKTKIIAIRKEK